ncbi:MAG: sugar transferase [Bryobacterales bacterium]|nr:sugar transferase [Bryobacterales bacterium]
MSSRCLTSAWCVPARQHSPPSRLVRLAERISAPLLFIAFLPALIFVAAAIYFLSGRAPLVAHRRLGLFGQPFWMLKFRSMWPAGARAITSTSFVEYLTEDVRCEPKLLCDPRVTSRFASFCRRYSIDELPQLWHVVQGKMSYVGPRPLTAREMEVHYGSDAPEILRHRPGISGLWQVLGRSRLTYRQRKRLDLLLVRRSSFSLYLAVLARTVPAVVMGKSAW